MIVEAKDVKFHEIVPIRKNEGEFIKVRGLVFHSSMAVKKSEITYNENIAIIKVYITPAHSGLSGSFTVEVNIKDGIDKILFGEQLTQIWPNAKNNE